MPYKFINSSEPHHIELERENPILTSIIFTFVGAIFFCIGVLLNFLMDGYELPNILFKIVFPLMGGIFVVVGISMPAMIRKTTPAKIIFDNRKGAVSIQMVKDADQIGYIRYDEIEKFDIYVESRSSSSSSGRTSTTYYSYHVFLEKKDGGQWFLTESNTRAKAEAIIQRFYTEVQLKTPYSLRTTAVFSDKLQKEDSREKTTVRWKNKTSLIAPLFLLGFIIIFSCVAISFFTGDHNAGWVFGIFASVVIGFIFLVFCIITYVLGKRWLKDATTIYSIVIDKSKLEYLELTKTEEVRNSRVLPLKDIISISYSYSPARDYTMRGLNILSQKDLDRIKSYKENPLESIKDFFKEENSPIQLNINALNPVECLQLETWLQELILKKAEVSVK